MQGPERFPAGTAIVADDIDGCGWKAAIHGIPDADEHVLSRRLAETAKAAAAEERFAHCRVLCLLSDALSMMLRASDSRAPFRPAIEFFEPQHQRSPIPSDFSKEDIEFLGSIHQRLDNPCVAGRIADLVWLQNKKLGAGTAFAAIDAYTSRPIEHSTWAGQNAKYWERALILALETGKAGSDRLARIEAALFVALEASDAGQAFFPLQLSAVFFRHGLARSKAPVVAAKLLAIAEHHSGAGNFHPANSYGVAAAEWFDLGRNPERRARSLVVAAEALVNEVNSRARSEAGIGLLGIDHYNKAIETLRSIPRSQRLPFGVDRRIAELELLLTQAGLMTVDQMTEFRTPGTDVSDLVRQVRRSVQGLDPLDALTVFTRDLHSGASYARLKAEVEESHRTHLFSGLFDTVVVGNDGRILARQPGAGLGTGPSADRELRVMGDMVRNYTRQIGFVTSVQILPALEVIQEEHKLDLDDFIGICQRSPIVSKDHTIMLAKALFAGFDREFGSSIYLLAPQIEHIVRTILKRRAVSTTHLKDGIVNEVGLSNLLDKAEVRDIFGEDLAFELQALFCDAVGANLRNEVAHGLLTDGAAHSGSSIYAWWFALRWVFLTGLGMGHAVKRRPSSIRRFRQRSTLPRKAALRKARFLGNP